MLVHRKHRAVLIPVRGNAVFQRDPARSEQFGNLGGSIIPADTLVRIEDKEAAILASRGAGKSLAVLRTCLHKLKTTQ